MTHNIYFSLFVFWPYVIDSVCNHYYQSKSISSTKRPFDLCYHSEVDEDTLKGTSFNYICSQSTVSDHGNNSVNGFTAFRQSFDNVDCQGTPTETLIVQTPFLILCSESPQCDILRVRQHPIINATSCTFNQSVYAEDIEVVAICDNNGDQSEALFCNKQDSVSSTDRSSYFWSNKYYGGQCENHRLFEATYQFHGCQGDGNTYLEIVECGANQQGMDNKVQPFDDGVFVAGFILLLIAILFIIFVLIWFCCWFRSGRRINNKMNVAIARSGDNRDHDDNFLRDEDNQISNVQTTR